MKNALFSIIAFVALFVTGCNENSITNPVLLERVNKIQVVDRISSQGRIPLEGILVQPGGFNSYLSVEGQIEFSHELVLTDQDSIDPRHNVQLNLSVNAVLTNPDLPIGVQWHVSENTGDNFYVSKDGIYLLVKSFTIQGRTDGLVLMCQFLVTTDGLALSAIWLTWANKE